MKTPPLQSSPTTARGEQSGHEIVSCESWRAFRDRITFELFDGNPFQRGVYLFRGHALSGFPLISTFDRWYSGPRGQKMRVFAQLLASFRQEAEGQGVDSEVWSDEVTTLALAQHHGLPTRLLDWTESPFIAAFFAYSGRAFGAPTEDPVAVWALDSRSPIWSGESGAEILEVPTLGNSRLRRQLGRFTLLRAPFDSLEEYVSHFPDEKTALTQYLIPAGDVRVAMAELEMMGITHTQLFSDLDGAARAARLRTLLQTEGSSGPVPSSPSINKRK